MKYTSTVTVTLIGDTTFDNVIDHEEIFTEEMAIKNTVTQVIFFKNIVESGNEYYTSSAVKKIKITALNVEN